MTVILYEKGQFTLVNLKKKILFSVYFDDNNNLLHSQKPVLIGIEIVTNII